MDRKARLKSIPILGKVYKIKHKKGLKLRTGAVDGICDGNIREIWIDSSLKGEIYLQTLLHEINHALIYESGLYCTDLPANLQEIICELFAKTYIEIFNLEIKLQEST